MMNMEQYLNYSGFLKKNSPSVFSGYQKRFFKILQGKALVYFEKDTDKEPKGQIKLGPGVTIESFDKKGLKVVMEGRTFDLKAETQEERDQWVSILRYFNEECKKNSKGSFDSGGSGSLPRSQTKAWKLNQADSDIVDIMKVSGIGIDGGNDDNLSKECFEKKGWSKKLKMTDKKIECRVFHGMLFKKRKGSIDVLQKRWFIIVSSRPLTDFGYDNDEEVIDSSKIPSFAEFDTLYYYKADDTEIDPKGGINMSECSGLEMKDTSDKYHLIIDMGGRLFELTSNLKGERDKWYEILKNARRTAKEIKMSKTKKPRNIQKIENILLKNGPAAVREKAISEKDYIVEKIPIEGSLDSLDFLVGKLRSTLIQVADGCLLSTIPKTELLEIYVDVFNTAVLELLEEFWNESFNTLSTIDLLTVAKILYDYDKEIGIYGIKDANFITNAKEIIKIYTKKTFFSIRELIESTLKAERQSKATINEDQLYFTDGPRSLMKFFYSVLNTITSFEMKYLYECLFDAFKECVIQYLLGLDYIVNRNDLVVEESFLLAICNNTFEITLNLTELIEHVESKGILTQSEIEENLNEIEISKVLNLVMNNAIFRLVNEQSHIVSKEFQINFMQIDLGNAMGNILTHFAKYDKHLNLSSKRRFFSEVFKILMINYLKSLLTTAHKKVKKIDELVRKLKDDYSLLLDDFSAILGENITIENLKSLNDFNNFLESSPDMIGIVCEKLREANGSSFTLSTVKALINLRCDLTKDERNEAIKDCKETLEKYDKTKDTNKGINIFSFVENELKKEEEEIEDNYSSINDQSINDAQRRGTLNLEDFLNYQEDFEAEEKKVEPQETVFFNKTNKSNIDSDVIISGLLKKKSHSKWQERFFSLKNGALWWYINQNSREAQNKIAVNTMKKIESHKPSKFLIDCGDKVYKFACDNDEISQNWISFIRAEIKKESLEKKFENLIEILNKPKKIKDHYKLKNINSDRLYIRNVVAEQMKSEKYFAFKVLPSVSKKPEKKQEQKEQSVIIDERRVPTMANEENNSNNINTIQTFDIEDVPTTNKPPNIFAACCQKINSLFGNKPKGNQMLVNNSNNY